MQQKRLLKGPKKAKTHLFRKEEKTHAEDADRIKNSTESTVQPFAKGRSMISDYSKNQKYKFIRTHFQWLIFFLNYTGVNIKFD
jgi:glycyl-tRNA synthetase beta subunit